MPKCDACGAEGARQRCSKCQVCLPPGPASRLRVLDCRPAGSATKCARNARGDLGTSSTARRIPRSSDTSRSRIAFERSLAKEPKLETPDDAQCDICFDGGDVLRGCACRGPSAGFAHVDCLAEMAARDEWMTLEDQRQLSRWSHFSPTCRAAFCAGLGVRMARRQWRHFRSAPDSYDKRQVFGFVADRYAWTPRRDRRSPSTGRRRDTRSGARRSSRPPC